MFYMLLHTTYNIHINILPVYLLFYFLILFKKIILFFITNYEFFGNDWKYFKNVLLIFVAWDIHYWLFSLNSLSLSWPNWIRLLWSCIVKMLNLFKAFFFCVILTYNNFFLFTLFYYNIPFLLPGTRFLPFSLTHSHDQCVCLCFDPHLTCTRARSQTFFLDGVHF